MRKSTYGPPAHRLHRIEARLTVPTRETNWTSSLIVEGYSQTKRSPLWSAVESFDEYRPGMALSMVDAAQHVLLVAVQEHPTSQDLLEFHLRGGRKFEDQPLPF